MALSAHREWQNSLKEFLFLNTGSSTKNWLSSFSIVCQTHRSVLDGIIMIDLKKKNHVYIFENTFFSFNISGKEGS